LWVANTSAGTGDGAVPGTTSALAVSGIKSNWTTTSVLGQTVALNVVARGGHANALNSGDTAAINVNVGVSNTNNFASQLEGISGYFPAGSTTNSLVINAQIGSIRATGLDTGGNTGIGVLVQAQNGVLGTAFQASNLAAAPKYGNASSWSGGFLKYIYDDGVHTPYTAMAVDATGRLTLAGAGAINTNQKTWRVGVSVVNNLELLDSAQAVVIQSITNTGDMSIAGALTVNGAAASIFTAGGVQLPVAANGSVATVLGSVGPTGSHTAVQEWIQIKGSGGAVRYLPGF
jgi:hypothetical protein